MTGTLHAMTLTVNGAQHRLSVPARWTLADALRQGCGLTGTHLGCEHGVCGACTVRLDGAPARACLIFAVQCDGGTVRTVEGLAEGARLGLLQRAFHEHHALQCGYCTPGFLMLAEAILDEDPDMPEQEMIDRLSSNLCRCTGYANILKAVRAAAAAWPR